MQVCALSTISHYATLLHPNQRYCVKWEQWDLVYILVTADYAYFGICETVAHASPFPFVFILQVVHRRLSSHEIHALNFLLYLTNDLFSV